MEIWRVKQRDIAERSKRVDMLRMGATRLNLPDLVPQEHVWPPLLVPLDHLDEVPPKRNLDTALEEPRAWLDAVLGANLIPCVPPDDGGPISGLAVPDVDCGRLVGVAIKGHGEYFALVAGDVVRVEADVTGNGQSVVHVRLRETSYLRSPRPIDTDLKRKRGTSSADGQFFIC